MVLSKQKWQYKMRITNEYVQVIENVPVKILTVVVHEFSMSDVEDPIVYAAEPLIKWEKSEEGQFVMSRSIEKPEWRQWLDNESFCTRICVIAKLQEKDVSYFALKFK